MNRWIWKLAAGIALAGARAWAQAPAEAEPRTMPADAYPADSSPVSGSDQSGPAGNAHPQREELSASTGENPFGRPQITHFDVDKKRAFAQAVDVGPLKDLAVFHNGRVKILQTLAKETVESIAARKDFVDFKVRSDGKAEKFHYDPVFTLIDLVIDPAYYYDKPLMHVEYPPLREAYLEKLYQNPDEREWWKRLRRLKPMDLMSVGEEIESGFAFDQKSLRSRSQIREAFRLYQDSWKNLLMVAPKSTENAWHNLNELVPGSPADLAVRKLGAAWRAGDAPAANEAIRTLARELPQINPAHYPTTPRNLEAAYNRLNAFEWGFWLYALALVNLLLAFGTGRKWLRIVGIAALFAALGMHGFGFAARCIIAERYAIQNQFESMTGLSLFAVLVGTVLMLARKQWLFGAAAAGVGFMILVTATQTGIPGQNVEREAAILNTSVLLKYHVTTVLMSYALIALGFMVSLLYIAAYYLGRRSRTHQGREPSVDHEAVTRLASQALGIADSDAASLGMTRLLVDLDKAQMIVLQLAFWTLGVGILLGAWWADHSWGRWWAFDPKELWALVTWIVYLIVIHIRLGLGGQKRGWWTALLSIIGFFVMLWTYFGVNLLLPGLHAYA